MTTSQTLFLATLLFLNVIRVAATSWLRPDLSIKVVLPFVLYLPTWWAFLTILIGSGIASVMSPDSAALTLSLAALGCLTLLHAATHVLVATVVNPAIRVIRRRRAVSLRPGPVGPPLSTAASALERDPVPVPTQEQS